LEAGVLKPPSAPRAIHLPDQTRSGPPLGQGFEVKVDCAWQNPDTSETVMWTEFVVRRGLASTGDTLKGLSAGNPIRATDQPSAERLVKAFDHITLDQHENTTHIWYVVTELSPLQRRILQLISP
jgi:hypothetical protein